MLVSAGVMGLTAKCWRATATHLRLHRPRPPTLLWVCLAPSSLLRRQALVSAFHIRIASFGSVKMRYEDWDVLLFPAGSKVPLKEFKTSCHVITDHGM
jgi:hypothetical protein